MPKFNFVNPSKILLYACPTTLSHTMRNQQLRWPTNDLLERNLRFWLLSWLNTSSSNATVGKSIGTPMGPRCKRKFEYSSDRYEKSLYPKGKTLVMVTSVFLSLHSLIKHTKLLACISLLKNWSSRKTKNEKEVLG